MTRSDRAIAEAAREAREAIGAIYARREFTVSKFARHELGYLHARVVVAGKPYYFHRRYGSWLAPGHVGGRAVLKEPEALLGSVLGREVKYALSEKSSPYDAADRREREAKQAKSKPKPQEANDGDGTGADDPTGSDRGLPEGTDHRDAEDDVRQV